VLRGLGRFIAKRRKALLAVWIVVLVVSIPLAIHLNDVLVYNEEAFMPKNVESLKAEKIMSREFPKLEETSLVVVVAHNVSDTRLEKAVRSFEQEAPGKIPQLKDIESIYDVYSIILAKYWQVMNTTYKKIYGEVLEGAKQLHDNMYGLKENLTKIHAAIIQTKEQIVELHKNIQETKSSIGELLTLVYGVPGLYLQAWGAVLNKTAHQAPATPISMVDEEALTVAEKNLPANASQTARQYMEEFSKQWTAMLQEKLGGNATALQAGIAVARGMINVTALAQQIILKEAPPMLHQYFNMDEALAEKMVSFFNLKNFRDKEALRKFVVSLFEEKTGGMVPTGAIEMLYDEGPTLSDKTLRSLTELLVSARLASMGVKLPPQLLETLYNLGEHPSEDQWRSLVVELTVSNAGKMGMNVSRSMAEAVYNLGPNPSSQAYEKLAESIAKEQLDKIISQHPPPRFPQDIPQDIRSRMINKNGTVMLLSIAFKPGYTSRELTNATRLLMKLFKSELEKQGIADSTKSYFTGTPAFNADMEDSTKGDVERIDRMTVVLVIVLLAALLTSIVAPLIPLFTVGVAIVLALAALYLQGKYVMDLPYLIRNMITPVLMGVGVDYSIYMLYRFKEELDKGKGKDEATEEAVTFAGEAIISAAFTVMVGFGALAASGFSMLRSMGIGLAVSVLMALIAALLLTSTILSLLGVKGFWPYKPSGRKKGGLRAGYLRRAAEAATRRPAAIITVFLVLTAISGAVLLGMHRTYDYTELMPKTQSIKGFKILQNEFGLGGLSMAYLVVSFNQPVVENGVLTQKAYNTLKTIVEKLSSIKGVDKNTIVSLVSPRGRLLSYQQAANISANPVVEQTLGVDNRTVLVMASLKYPSMTMKAFNTIQDVRKAVRGVVENNGGKLYVGGESAVMDDMNNLVNYEFTYKILPIAIIGIFIVLFALLRSATIALSLLAAIGTSIAWALALLVATFQWILGIKIYWLTPIMITTALLGLGMDYGIFLVTRVKEEMIKGKEKVEAIITAVETTGMVITACGIIMAAAFGSLGVSSFKMLQEMGFAFAAAVLLDTFLVRPLFLPSILRLSKWREKKT